MNYFALSVGRAVLAGVLVSALIGCSGGPERAKPSELGPSVGLIGVKQVWSVKVGPVNFPLSVKVGGSAFTMASSDGMIQSLDAASGRVLWQTNVGTPITAGVGGDGRYAAVMTEENELVVLDGANEVWRERLPAQGYTAPLVAGGRVFVLTADRTVTAFDLRSGRKIWAQQRTGDSLVLKQSGVLLAVSDTLVAGLSGRLVGLQPANGSTRWEVPVASSRGTNEIERLVDLVGGVGRSGSVVCARAFQSGVGCVDAVRGSLLWTQDATGSVGLDGDDKHVYGVESNGKLIAWKRSDGAVAWQVERLQYRDLTAPLVLGRSVIVGDGSGLLHLVSREDGSSLARLSTDGTAISTVPVTVAGTLIVVTRSGGVFGFRPE